MARLNVVIIFLVSVLVVATAFAQYEPAGCLNQDEELLAQLVNEYRVANSLNDIPLSQTLTLVAQWHVADHDYATEVTGEYGSDPNCSQYSWYGIPGAPYTTCCFSGDQADYPCMWDKPSEISNNVYTAYGFELAAYGYASVEDALQAWQDSFVHNDMILNLGMWSSFVWRAMGTGVDSGRYFVWFSTLDDPEGVPVPSVSSATEGDVVDRVFLDDAYPNPFNPQTTIVFEIPRRQIVTLRVFDMSGRSVNVLIDAEEYAPGSHDTVWNGRDEHGRRVPSGTYFYRLEAGEFCETKRMVLVK